MGSITFYNVHNWLARNTEKFEEESADDKLIYVFGTVLDDINKKNSINEDVKRIFDCNNNKLKLNV